VEIRHEDPTNSPAWRDLVVNNKEQIDISGDVSINNHLSVVDASFGGDVNVVGTIISNDVSINNHLSVVDASFGGNVDISGSQLKLGSDTILYSSKGQGATHMRFVNTEDTDNELIIGNSTHHGFKSPVIKFKTDTDGANECFIGKARSAGEDFHIHNGNDGTDDIDIRATGVIRTNASFFPISDNRVKHNEQPITNALENIRRLQGLKYFKTTRVYDENHDFPLDASGLPIIPLDASGNPILWKYEQGFIAQSVLEIDDFKHFVWTNPTNKRDPITNEIYPYSLQYDGLFVNNIVATQQLADKVDELEARLKTIEQLNM
jgi:cytoskeletal protein CcmA (bactofilin family)